MPAPLSARWLPLAGLLLVLLYISANSYYQTRTLFENNQAAFLNNYRSLAYAQQMLWYADSLENQPQTIRLFAEQLALQTQNITENGEKSLTDALQAGFDDFLQTPDQKNRFLPMIKTHLHRIHALNLQAIVQKTELAEHQTSILGYWVFVQGFLGVCVLGFFGYLHLRIRKSDRLDSLKTNFIATISHELKTPISTIKLGVQLLQNPKLGGLNPSQNELISNIADDTNRLLEMTNELLKNAQLEAGQVQMHARPTHIEGVIQYALNTLTAPIKSKNIQLSLEIPEHLGMVSIDEEKTAWVLTNILSNAIRYSPENERIIISVQSTTTHLELSVQDFGKGIPLAYQQKIFERYFQTPNQERQEKGSAGLGLAISKEFMEQQKGQIRVHSEPNKGATFTLSLLWA